VTYVKYVKRDVYKIKKYPKESKDTHSRDPEKSKRELQKSPIRLKRDV